MANLGGCGLDPSGFGQVQTLGSCEHGSDASSSIKCCEFIDNLRREFGQHHPIVTYTLAIQSTQTQHPNIILSFIIISYDMVRSIIRSSGTA
jgi:hypothetical protein